MKLQIAIFVTTMFAGAVVLTFLNNSSDEKVAQEVVAQEVEVAAQFEEPFLTVAIHSTGRIQKDMEYITSSLGLSAYELAQISDELEEFFDYMQAVDEDRPAAILFWESDDFDYELDETDDLFCFPVTDVQKFTKMLEKYGTVNECALGWVYKPDDGSKKKLMCHDGEYLFVTHKKERLKEVLPTNLEETLRSCVGENTAAVKMDLTRAPEDAKDSAIEALRENSSNSFLNFEDSQYMAETQRWVEDWIRDTDQITLTLNIDKESKQLQCQAHVQAAENSATAEEAAKNVALKSKRFADFRRNKFSAMRLHLQSANLAECLEGLKADIKRFVEQSKSEDETKRAPAITKALESPIPDLDKKLEAMLDSTIESGNVEFAANVYFDGNFLNSLIAFRFQDTSVLYELIQAAQDSEDSPFNGPNAEKHGFKGIENDADLTMMIFDNPKTAEIYEGLPFKASRHAVVAFDNEAVYLAMGRHGKKRLLDFVHDGRKASESECVSSFEINLDALFRGTMPAFVYNMMKSELKNGDKIAFHVKPVENGYKANASFDLGLINLIKSMSNQVPTSPGGFQDASTTTPAVRVHSRPQRIQGFAPVSDSLETKAEREFQKGFNEGLRKSLERN